MQQLWEEFLARMATAAVASDARQVTGAAKPAWWPQALAAKAVDDLLERSGNGKLRRPLLELLEAFGDLERGNQSELLRPRDAGGRRQPPLAEQRRIARAVRAMDLLTEAGEKPARAAETVWRTVNWWPLAISPQVLREWRKGLHRKDSRGFDVARRLMTMALPIEAGASAREQAAYLMRSLAEDPEKPV